MLELCTLNITFWFFQPTYRLQSKAAYIIYPFLLTIFLSSPISFSFSTCLSSNCSVPLGFYSTSIAIMLFSCTFLPSFMSISSTHCFLSKSCLYIYVLHNILWKCALVIYSWVKMQWSLTCIRGEQWLNLTENKSDGALIVAFRWRLSPDSVSGRWQWRKWFMRRELHLYL